MFPNEIVNSEMNGNRVLVHFNAFTVSERFASKSLQSCRTVKNARSTWLVVRLSKSGEPTTALRSAVSHLANAFIASQTCQRAIGQFRRAEYLCFCSVSVSLVSKKLPFVCRWYLQNVNRNCAAPENFGKKLYVRQNRGGDWLGL